MLYDALSMIKKWMDYCTWTQDLYNAVFGYVFAKPSIASFPFKNQLVCISVLIYKYIE